MSLAGASSLLSQHVGGIYYIRANHCLAKHLRTAVGELKHTFRRDGNPSRGGPGAAALPSALIS